MKHFHKQQVDKSKLITLTNFEKLKFRAFALRRSKVFSLTRLTMEILRQDSLFTLISIDLRHSYPVTCSFKTWLIMTQRGGGRGGGWHKNAKCLNVSMVYCL